MSTIVFKILQEPGHHTPTYSIAKQLQNKGHKIIYASSAEFKEEILTYGFAFEDTPEICKSNVVKTYKLSKIIPRFVLKSLKNINDYKNLVELVISDSKKITKKYKPDLILLDDLKTPYIISYCKYKIPVLMLSTYLSQNRDKCVPPIRSRHIPKNNFFNKIWIELIWLKVVFAFRAHTYLGYYRQNLKLAKKCDFDLKKRINHKRSFLFGIKNIPTIVLCPSELDFPGRSKNNRYNVGVSFNDKRNSVPFNWDEIDSSTDIVYCSLGTQAQFHYKNCKGFYDKVIRIFSKMPQYTLIVSLWKFIDINHFQNVPSNIKIYNIVPQLDVLKKSKLLITHGGLGSIKESILSGVPMLVFPVNLTSDQNGNAARVVYHKLGLRGKIRTESTKSIKRKISKILSDNQYINNIEKMKEIFNSYENKMDATSIIESHIKQKTIINTELSANQIIEK